MPRVSVITPCFNAERFLARTIDSVRAQTFGDFEHVIVDDGSADRSADLANSCAIGDGRISVIRQSNQGCAQSRNFGFRAANRSSDYLLFLDADDLLEPEMLETLVAYLDAHAEVGMAYGGFRLIDEHDALLPLEPLDAGWRPRYVPAAMGLGVRELSADEPETPFLSLFAIPAIIPSVCLFRRSVYSQTPGWDEELGVIYEDVGLYLHCALRSKVHYVPRKLVRYRKHAQQSSSSAEKFHNHERRLYAKWRDVPGLSDAQRKVVLNAWRFREGPLTLHRGFREGSLWLRKGKVSRAARFYAGAMRSYAASMLPGHTVG